MRINRERGIAFLIAETNTSAALEMADYGYVLNEGQVTQEGTGASLREQLHETI